MAELTLESLPNDVKVCNCADCGRLLIGKQSEPWFLAHYDRTNLDYDPVVAGRISDRPYCGDCLTSECYGVA